MTKTSTVRQTGIAPPVCSGLLQRQCSCGQHTAGGECAECRSQDEKAEVPGIVREVLSSAGEPLDPETRGFLEPRFSAEFSSLPAQLSASPADTLRIGSARDPLESAADSAAERALNSPAGSDGVDFGRVRIHHGPQAAAAARAVQSRAFTVGSHLVFGDGEFQPRSNAGQRLLAHELAHVLQQTGPVIRRRIAKDSVAMTPPEADTYADARQPDGPDPDDELDRDGKSAADRDRNPISAPGNKEAAKDAAAKTVRPQAAPGAGKAPTAASLSMAKPTAAPAAGKAAEPKSIGDLATGDLALVDTELAEHQRWAAASAKVGAADSKERAAFIAQSAGKPGNFWESAGQGAKMAAEIKIAEKIIGKVVLKLAVKRLGAQAVKFTPVPGIGAIVGGAISGYELATRDWRATGETIGKFGTGKSQYDEIANDIEAISEVIDVATQVLNVIAGVIGAISFGMWAVSIATVGIASPLAFTLSAIAGGIGIASMVLDGINALVLKQLVTVFRALDAFTSDADPSEVVAEGEAISKSAGSADSFLGGLAGGAAVDHGLKGLEEKKPGAPPAEHKTPPPLEGEGGFVKGEVPPEGLKPSTESTAAPAQNAPPAETPKPAKAPTAVDSPPAPEAAPAKKSVAPEKTKSPSKVEPSKAASKTEPVKAGEGAKAEPAKQKKPAREVAPEKPPGTPEELFGKGPITADEVDAMFDPKAEGPVVAVPTNREATPAKVLEVGAGKVQTDLGLPPEKELVDVTHTDFNPQRPDVQFLDGTKAPPEHTHGKYDTVIVNNPHGYVPDVAELGKTLKPEGRIIAQGKAETFPGERGVNGDYQKLLESKAPAGFTREEPPSPTNRPKQFDLTPAKENAVPGKIMGGPFRFTSGDPAHSLPNSRITFFKEPIAGGAPEITAPKAPAASHAVEGAASAPIESAGPNEAGKTDAAPKSAKPVAQEAPKEKRIEARGPESDKPVTQADAAGGGAVKPPEPPPSEGGSSNEPPGKKSKKGKSPEETKREAKARGSKGKFLERLVRAIRNPDLHDQATYDAVKRLKASQIEQLKNLPEGFDFRKWANQAVEFESTPEERAMADARENQGVEPEIGQTPGKKPRHAILAQKGDPQPGRPQNKPPGFDNWTRKKAKAGFEREMREAVLNPELHNDRTLATLETLDADEVANLEEEPVKKSRRKRGEPTQPETLSEEEDRREAATRGKLPASHDFAHRATVADSPETAHKSESGLSLPHKEHMGKDHAGEPAVPLETMSPRDPGFDENWGWQAGSEREIVSQTETGWNRAESDAAIGKDIEWQAKKLRVRSQKLREASAKASEASSGTRAWLPAEPAPPGKDPYRSSRQHMERQEKLAAKALAKATQLEQQASELDQARADLAAKIQAAKAKGGKNPPPAGSPPPAPSPTPAPQPGPPPEPGPPPQPSDALQPNMRADQSSPKTAAGASSSAKAESAPTAMVENSTGSRQDEPAVEASRPPETRLATTLADAAEIADEADSNSSPEESAAPAAPSVSADPAAPPPGLPPLPPPKSLENPPEPQPKGQFQQNMKDFAGVDPRKLTLGESAMFQAMGPAGVVAMRSAIKAHNEPVVRHVNPAYSPPPCAPEQITLIQKDILQALEARAQAEKISDAMTRQEKHHKENEKPIGQMGKATDKQITAAEAHQEAVARRNEANGQMQGKEKVVDGLVASYPQKADGLDTIRGLMGGFSRFTHLGYDLPDWDSLATVKSCIIHMDGDTRRFLHQLDQMKQEMEQQQTAKEGRKQQLDSNAELLNKTGTQASDSKDSLQDARDTTDQLDKDNHARLDEATKMHNQANGDAQALQNDADQKKAKAQSMAAALDQWAQNHRSARLEALKQTQASLEAQGYRITEVKEL
jgi:hypothetical protein